MHHVNVKGILSSDNIMNVYRGCSHGCIYCDSRSLCYGFTHMFEDIEVKQNAPELLEQALRTKRKKCMIGTGSMCDPYLPIEETEQITGRCLELILQYGYGASVLTKSARVLRDKDLLVSINSKAKAVVQMTLTTADESLCRLIEPNVSTTKERFDALMTFKQAGIPTLVWFSPILPFINDTAKNLNGILDYCIEAGVKGIICFDMGLTLRDGDREYFYRALDRHFPGLKERYIRTYGNAYTLTSPNSAELWRLFNKRCGENGILHTPEDCFRYLRDFPDQTKQLSLFELE